MPTNTYLFSINGILSWTARKGNRMRPLMLFGFVWVLCFLPGLVRVTSHVCICICMCVCLLGTHTQPYHYLHLETYWTLKTGIPETGERMASMSSKQEDLQTIGKARPGSHSQGHIDSGNVQDNLTNSGCWIMTCSWISSKNADHTQKDTYFESFGREKGT